MCRFCICKFADSLKFTCNPESILLELLQSFPDMCRTVKNSSGLTCTFQATLCLHVSAHTVNKGPFCGLFSATFFTFLSLLLGDFAP